MTQQRKPLQLPPDKPQEAAEGVGAPAEPRASQGIPTRPNGLDSQAWSTLTINERKVVKYLLQGLSNDEIGQVLHIGTSTVKTHLNHIFKKLQVHSRLEIINRSSD